MNLKASQGERLQMQLASSSLCASGWLCKSKKIVYKEMLHERRYEERVSSGDILSADVNQTFLQHVYEEEVKGKCNQI